MDSDPKYSRGLAAAVLALSTAVSAAVPTVVSGPDYTLALSRAGKVYAWGADARGQLGSGRKLHAAETAKVVGLPPIVSVDGGTEHVAAVDWLGYVWTWGRDTAGQLGPRTPSPWTVPGRVNGVTGVTSLTASRHFTAALKSDGTVVVWGTFAQERRAPQPLAGLTGIVELRSGDGHIVALRSDGSVWTAGANTVGELGDGTSGAGRANAAQVAGLANIVRIAAGDCGSMALANDGTVYAWGRAACAATAPRLTPTAIPGLANVADIAGGRDRAQAVLVNGSIASWDNTYAPAPRPGFVAVVQAATDTGDETLARLSNGTVVVTGRNELGQHAQGHTEPIAAISLVPNLLNVAQVATAHAASGGITHFARLSNGDLHAWGSGLDGHLGTGGALVTSVPQEIAGLPPIERIAAGDLAAYALDATGQVWAWGDNGGFALGDTTETPRSTPVAVAGLAGVAEVAAGRRFVLFRMGDGTVRILGSPLATAAYAPPEPVPGLADIATIAARNANAYAISTTGIAYAWGAGTDGLIGDGLAQDRVAPVAITAFDSPVRAIAAGRFHALARTDDGTVWSWGTDEFTGALGDGVNGSHVRLTPARVPNVLGATGVAAGHAHSLARLANGQALSWGSRALGDGANDVRNASGPVRTIANATTIAAGNDASFALGSDGVVYGWGGGAAASGGSARGIALTGDGTFAYRAEPTLVIRDAAAGNLDGADWFLDLDPGAANTIPPSLVPVTLAVARADLSEGSVTLDARIHFRSSDAGRKVRTYILARVPGEFVGGLRLAPGVAAKQARARAKAGVPVLVQLTPAGWTPVDGQLVGYTQGVVGGNGAALVVLDDVGLPAIAGATFCIGYGEDTGSMLSAVTLAEVLAMPGAAAGVAGVPCMSAGVYVDGPSVAASGATSTFEATVVGLAPGGNVRFFDGFYDLGSAVALAPSNPAVSRAARTASLGIGVHSIGVDYAGNAQNPAATTAIPMLHTVSGTPGGSSVALAIPPSALLGDTATFVATVTGDNPTGLVQFRDGVTDIGGPVAIVGQLAILPVTMSLGVHAIRAAYLGDASNPPSISGPMPFVVVSVSNLAVMLAATPAAPQVATPVKLTATIAPGAPAGTVRFLDHGVPISASVALASGKAEYTHAAFAPGTHVITASYGGNAANAPTISAPLVITVPVALDTTQEEGDVDGDGIPNGIELDEARNPLIKDNSIFAVARLFAMQQYRDFLGREGDAAGVAHWTGQLDTGLQSRGQMVETYFTSAEFQGTGAPVARLYFAYFLRVPDYGGLNHWIGQFRAGAPLIDISNAFATSPEFVARYGALSNGQFVERVYVNVLGRLPDNAGLSFWIAQLNAGMSRGQMMVAFSESIEYRSIIANEIYVTMMYVGMLRRTPEPDGFSFWVGYLDGGSSGLALIDGFLTSAEYRNRFLP